VRPFLSLAEQLGRCFACLNEGLPERLDVEYQGGLATANTSILTLAVLKGVFTTGTEEPVSYVNAPQLAAERGLEVREVSTSTTRDFVNLITLRSEEHAVAGTLSGPRSEARIVMVDDHAVEVPPAEHMLVVRNDDRPGMIGAVGTALGDAGISISSMTVGPSRSGNTALMVLSTDRPISDGVMTLLGAADGILDVHRMTSV
jgi:D-3-phosphoglycerate dehydrogenase